MALVLVPQMLGIIWLNLQMTPSISYRVPAHHPCVTRATFTSHLSCLFTCSLADRNPTDAQPVPCHIGAQHRLPVLGQRLAKAWCVC